MQGIPLAFRPPTVRHLHYCAAEEMTNYTQFCTAQLHCADYVCALCEYITDGRGPPWIKIPYVCLTASIWRAKALCQLRLRVGRLLTLGAHARSEGYCSCPVCVCVYVCMCVCLCVCVCVSVRSFLLPRASRPRNIGTYVFTATRKKL